MNIDKIFRAANVFQKYAAEEYVDDPAYTKAKQVMNNPNLATEFWSADQKSFNTIAQYTDENNAVRFQLSPVNGNWNVKVFPVLRDVNGTPQRVSPPQEAVNSLRNFIASKLPKPPKDLSFHIEASWIIG